MVYFKMHIIDDLSGTIYNNYNETATDCQGKPLNWVIVLVLFISQRQQDDRRFKQWYSWMAKR